MGDHPDAAVPQPEPSGEREVAVATAELPSSAAAEGRRTRSSLRGFRPPACGRAMVCRPRGFGSARNWRCRSSASDSNRGRGAAPTPGRFPVDRRTCAASAAQLVHVWSVVNRHHVGPPRRPPRYQLGGRSEWRRVGGPDQRPSGQVARTCLSRNLGQWRLPAASCAFQATAPGL